MQWDIINTEPLLPRCIFCDKSSQQMAKFMRIGKPGLYDYICSNCGRFVKDAMEKWIELKPKDWIEGPEFSSNLVDRLDVNTGGPSGTFSKPVGKDLTLDEQKRKYKYQSRHT